MNTWGGSNRSRLDLGKQGCKTGNDLKTYINVFIFQNIYSMAGT